MIAIVCVLHSRRRWCRSRCQVLAQAQQGVWCFFTKKSAIWYIVVTSHQPNVQEPRNIYFWIIYDFFLAQHLLKVSPALASVIGRWFSSVWSSSCNAWQVTIEIAEGKIILMALWTLTFQTIVLMTLWTFQTFTLAFNSISICCWRVIPSFLTAMRWFWPAPKEVQLQTRESRGSDIHPTHHTDWFTKWLRGK